MDIESILKRDEPLAPWTTLKIGGSAKFFLLAESTEAVIAGVAWAMANKLPWRIIGGGSNTLVADSGYGGLAIIARNSAITWAPPHVTVEAGVRLGQFIAQALQHGLGGLEWLIGVPGTIGGSLYGNAGSRDENIGQYVEYVDILQTGGQRIRWTQADCEFRYRTSRFKREPVVILEARLKLPPVDPAGERARLATKAKTKNASQPTSDSSAGCMFKNPSVADVSLPPELQAHVYPDKTVSAWRLIDFVGLRGQRIGQAQISDKHANFLVNLGGATADQAVQIISLVKQRVRDTIGIQLNEEVQYLGFDT